MISVHNYVKDLVLVTLLVIAVGGCWLAYMQHRYSQSQVKKLITDMKHLQDAETALGTLKQKYVQPGTEMKFSCFLFSKHECR